MGKDAKSAEAGARQGSEGARKGTQDARPPGNKSGESTGAESAQKQGDGKGGSGK